MKELIHRLTSDTPTFFKKLQVMGGSLAALGTGLINIPKIPVGVSNISGHLIWVGAVIVAVAQFACTNAPEKKV